jgi:hypothetical protein
MKLSRVVLRPLTAVLLSAALLPAAGFSQEVTGTFVVKGTSTPFRYAYAYWKDQAPFKKDVTNLYVLLSDVPLDAGTLPGNDRGNAKMAELARNEKVHAFELHFSGLGMRRVASGDRVAQPTRAPAIKRFYLPSFRPGFQGRCTRPIRTPQRNCRCSPV